MWFICWSKWLYLLATAWEPVLKFPGLSSPITQHLARSCSEWQADLNTYPSHSISRSISFTPEQEGMKRFMHLFWSVFCTSLCGWIQRSFYYSPKNPPMGSQIFQGPHNSMDFASCHLIGCRGNIPEPWKASPFLQVSIGLPETCERQACLSGHKCSRLLRWARDDL